LPPVRRTNLRADELERGHPAASTLLLRLRGGALERARAHHDHDGRVCAHDGFTRTKARGNRVSDAILANIALSILGAIGLVGVAVIAARALVWWLERQRTGRKR
jgi:hypothetical protein